MGGKGSGRKADPLKAFNAQRATPIAIGGEALEFPNHSGDNSAGNVLSTPANDTDIANKKYVDDEISTIDLSPYEKLDGTNQPATGNKNISKADPEFRLTDTGNDEYTEVTKSDTTNLAKRINRVEKPQSAAYTLTLKDADNEYVDLGINSYPVLSVGFWVTPSSMTTNRYISDPIWGSNKTTFRSQRRSIAFIWDSGAGVNRVSVAYGDNDSLQSSVAISNGVNTHIGVVFDSTNQIVKLYINGVLDGTGSVAGFGSDPAFDYYLGASNSHGSASLPTCDTVWDEMGIWDTELVADDFSDLYNSGTGLFIDTSNNFPTSGTPISTNIVQIIHFNDGSGSSLADSSGNGNTATGISFSGDEWNLGGIASPTTIADANIWLSQDGVGTGEKGIQTYGDPDGRTVIEGQSTRFNTSGVEQFQIDTTGALVFPDNYDYYAGDAKDIQIGTFDGTDFNTVGTGDWNITGFTNVEIENSALIVGDFSGGNYAKVSSGGDLSFYGTGDYIVQPNEYVFRYSGGANVGMFLNSVEGIFEFRDASGVSVFDIDVGPSIHLPFDNEKLYFGAGDDCSITYDGTDMNIKADEVGSGKLKVDGSLQAIDYYSGDGTQGITQSETGVTNFDIVIKDGLITSFTKN